MSKHELATVPIERPWSKIDPKVIVGAVSSLTVGGVVSVGAAVGLTIPTWVAALVVIVAYFVASYLTKTRIPVANNAGLSAEYVDAGNAAAAAGAEAAEGDLNDAIAKAFHSAGYILDADGNVIGERQDKPTV